jgi:hypothetical protein
MRFQLPLKFNLDLDLNLRLSALLLAIPAAACTQGASTPSEEDPDQVADAIELENGGFDTSDEAPMFADASLFASADLEADAAVADPMAADPGVRDLDISATASAYNAIVMWGRMPADRDGAVRDWSGALRLSRGAMVVRRRIAFEEATDRILPRTRGDEIQFTSRTSVHADGFALTILDPTPASASPLTLTYISADGAITYSVDLSAAVASPASPASVVRVDAGDGNQIVAIAHRRLDTCDHGFLRGRWHALAPDAGRYVGLVLGSDGEPAGHLRGIYGTRRSGEAVFFGKLIGPGGEFRGLVRGSYDAGHFQGRWLDRGGDRGVVQGGYRAGDTLRAGHLLGRWAEASCATRS